MTIETDLLAIFLDQVSSPSIQVKCMDAAQDPSYTRTILGMLPSIVGPLSGVAIAWLAFKWNRDKDQHRWVLENRKAEWKELISLAARIESIMPTYANGAMYKEAVNNEVVPLLQSILESTKRSLFVAPALQEIGTEQRITDLMEEADKAIGDILVYELKVSTHVFPATPTALEISKSLKARILAFHEHLQTSADADLNLRIEGGGRS